THDEWRERLDRLSDGHFTKQLTKLQQERPELFAEPHEVIDQEPMRAEVNEDQMEPLQPIALQVAHAREQGVTMHIGPYPRLVLDLAPHFRPDINMVLREGIFACGVKGSGKTGVLAKIIEQITLIAAQFDPAHLGIPLVVFDKEGDLESLGTIFPNGRIADLEHWYTAEEILTQRLQVVVNLQAWLKAEEAGKIMVTLVNDLIAYTGSLNPDKRPPCPVFLDEAQYWLPQESASYLSKETQKGLLDAFGILLNTGRKRGLTPFIFTQRIAQIDKSVISLGIQIFMRQVIDTDQKRCMEYIRLDIVGERKNLAQLSEGQGIVCLPKGVQLTVQFDERQSTHLSHAPTIDRILTRSTPITRESIAWVSASERPFPHKVQRRPPAPADRLKHSAARLPRILQEALNALTPNMTYRDLGAALGYSNGEARAIWQELRRRGLLHASGQVEAPRGQISDPSLPSAAARPALYSLPRPVVKQAPTDEQKKRQIAPSDLAKAFALWQAGYSSVRKLDAAAKEVGYGWSNGMCRDLQDAMEEHGLIPKREVGAV
ncbi:MAG: hypothetical protein ABI413_05980, partial [Ktedonobacteraceae bacterium]